MYNDSVSNLVKKEIIQNTMLGEKYITEANLCLRTDISRSKLRETLKALDSYGMIERKQKRGVALCTYTKEEVKELFELRIMLESKVVKKTVENATERDLIELQQLDNELEIAIKFGDKIESGVKDAVFHRKLIQISGSKIMFRMIDTLRVIESTMTINRIPQDAPPSVRDPYTHIDMIEAIRNRDVKTYKTLLVNHIQWVAKKVVKRLK
jgi:GntR family transcriptional regulator, gluconate operon transcriptional repressor